MDSWWPLFSASVTPRPLQIDAGPQLLHNLPGGGTGDHAGGQWWQELVRCGPRVRLSGKGTGQAARRFG